MDEHVGFAAVQSRNGTVTIPAHLRRRFCLDRPGSQVEIVVRDEEIVLLPQLDQLDQLDHLDHLDQLSNDRSDSEEFTRASRRIGEV